MLDQRISGVYAGDVCQSEGPEFRKLEKCNLLQRCNFVVVDLRHRVISQRCTLDVVYLEFRVEFEHF